MLDRSYSSLLKTRDQIIADKKLSLWFIIGQTKVNLFGRYTLLNHKTTLEQNGVSIEKKLNSIIHVLAKLCNEERARHLKQHSAHILFLEDYFDTLLDCIKIHRKLDENSASKVFLEMYSVFGHFQHYL